MANKKFSVAYYPAHEDIFGPLRLERGEQEK